MAAFQDWIEKLKAKFTRNKVNTGGASGDSHIMQIITPIIGLIIFVLVAYYAITQVQVNGPIFNQIKTVDDLRSSLSPPSLFIVEPYALAQNMHLALVDGNNARLETLKQQFEQNKLRYQESVKRWNNTALPKSLIGSYKSVVASAESFFTVYEDQLLPALQSGFVGTSSRALVELEKAYVTNNTLVQSFVKNLEKESKQTADNANSLLRNFLIGLGILALVIAVAIYLIGKRQVAATEAAMKLLEEDGQNNQLAVLELLDEMGDLSEGDLTVRAQVKENITGAIADSVNYTIDSLRDVVTEINRATEQVNAATGAAQGTSTALLEAAEMQSQQISETTEAVNGMTNSILQVSTNASQAAEVAQRSLQAASQGSQAVQNTIAGMNGIREQIQETSKRIKRLGESSQEIGEIVELISDITEQTNILALNAAIQAASAGEAGRGFTVVAEEVQRLAERSSEATKQIGAIVKTIQTDTNSAVAAMEKSTEGVVEGARLSDAAGQALTEIETVTNNLARLIQSISTATEAQTEAASQVTKNMQQIQEITTLTTDGTKQTTESIVQLTALADDLRKSVAGFKLS
ncbi:MAG: methyl-accepting chemotaxis protein [Methylotenera sp.]|jgi:twitching motility protein PilJ